jgi:hypothetical protein
VIFRVGAVQVQDLDDGEITPVKVSPDSAALRKVFDDIAKGEAPPSPEERKEEVVGIGSNNSMDGKRRRVREEEATHATGEVDLHTSFRTEDNDSSGLQFIAVKSNDFLPPKSEIEGSEGELLA